MLRLTGAVLTAASCAWIGFRKADALKSREQALWEMGQGLGLLAQELELDAPPLPRLMERLAARTQGCAGALFSGCCAGLERLDRESFPDLWRRLVGLCPQLGEDGMECLAGLGETLGRCGVDAQLRAVDGVRRQLEQLARCAREDTQRLGRVYRLMGLSGGGFLVILLL